MGCPNLSNSRLVCRNFTEWNEIFTVVEEKNLYLTTLEIKLHKDIPRQTKAERINDHQN
jgi:hypothetical protein